MIKLKYLGLSLGIHLFLLFSFFFFVRAEVKKVSSKYIELNLEWFSGLKGGANGKGLKKSSFSKKSGLGVKKKIVVKKRVKKKFIKKRRVKKIIKKKTVVIKKKEEFVKKTVSPKQVVKKEIKPVSSQTSVKKKVLKEKNQNPSKKKNLVTNKVLAFNKTISPNSSKTGSELKGLNSENKGKGGKGGQNVKGNGEGKKNKYLLEKFHIISRIVQKNIRYPFIARRMGWEGRVVLSFILTKKGTIKELKVESSSGYEVLDKNALETVKRCSKYFPVPPVDVKIKLPIVYRLE